MALPHRAGGRGCGRCEQVAVEALGNGVLHLLDLRRRIEVGGEALVCEAVLLRRRFESGTPRRTIGVLAALGQIGDPVGLRRRDVPRVELKNLLGVRDGVVRCRRRGAQPREQRDAHADRDGRRQRTPQRPTQFVTQLHHDIPSLVGMAPIDRVNPRASGIDREPTHIFPNVPHSPAARERRGPRGLLRRRVRTPADGWTPADTDHKVAGRRERTKRTKPMDGVRLAILNKRFEAICRKMANTLFRTGRSGVLNTARDFSCCIVTADCDLLATAESLPIHVLSGPDLMAASMKEFHPALRQGDAFLHNSPYHGCSHPADHTILVPVIDDDGRHRFTVLAKAHQADCGNSIATTYHGSARDVYEEGALIFPAVQVQRDYETIEDIVRMCRMRIRVPEQWWGDFLAMLGAARVGEREVMALADEVGWETLDRFAAEWFDYSERRMVEGAEGIARRQPHGRQHPRSHTRRAGRRDGQRLRTGRSGRGADRGQSSRQHGFAALRPQHERGLRAHLGDGRHLQRAAPHRAAQRWRLPPHRREAQARLRRGHPRASDLVLGRHHQRRRPHCQRRATRHRRARRWARHGRGRRRDFRRAAA